MHPFSQKALALDKLLILLMAVSVVSTGIWNMQVRSAASWSEAAGVGNEEEELTKAVDEIRYHVQLAGYKLTPDVEPLMVKKGRKSDLMRVCYNDITAEFFVDRSHNLVCRTGGNEKTLASGVASLRTVRLSPGTVVVTLKSLPAESQSSEGSKTLSRSYSTAIDSPWLL
jgi:hypothetical protein